MDKHAAGVPNAPRNSSQDQQLSRMQSCLLCVAIAERPFPLEVKSRVIVGGLLSSDNME